jgi:hypothetical protein
MLSWAQLAGAGASPPPALPLRTAHQTMSLKMTLGELWAQATAAGMTPPDIYSALAAGEGVGAAAGHGPALKSK